MNHISKPVPKVDGQEKAAGYAEYLGDIRLEGMLFAKTVRSQIPRGKIVSIDIPQLPEGYYTVGANDIPGKNLVKLIVDDQPVFAEDTVNYIGEPILLVVGPEKQVIADIISAISVSYEDLEPILTMEDAENGRFQPIYEGGSYFADYQYSHGEVDKAFQEAKHVIEGEYSTGYQEHIYLETQSVLGVYENEKISVYGSIQCPYYVKKALEYALGFGGDRVRVVQTTTGGAFGGKEEYPSLIAAQVAVAAYKTGKPVQLIFDRAEDIEVTCKRHPSVIRLKTALDETGRILAMIADIKLNAGAYAGKSNIVLQRSLFNINGVYNIPALKARGRTVVTNTVPSGAFRGFGGPQAIFAIEMQMQKIARETGIDLLTLKLLNLVKKGDLTATGGTFKQEIKLPEMIETVEQMSGYRKKINEFGKKDGNRLQGIGITPFQHGGGFTGSGERDLIKAVVKLKKHKNEKVEILVASCDMGQGLKTTLAKIVSEALGIPFEDIIYQNPDTDRVPDSGPTVASRTVMIVGKLLEEAAHKLKSQWKEGGELEVTEEYKHPADIRWDNDKFAGDAYPAYSFGVNAVEVEVDPVTLEVRVNGIWSVYDVGVAIDERILRGQIDGGMVQGLGYGALEVMECKDGKIQQRSVTDYIIPTSKDFIKIQSKLVDNPYDRGPFGAKGAGELTLVGAAAAFATAVGNALDKNIDKLPVTPEYILSRIQKSEFDL